MTHPPTGNFSQQDLWFREREIEALKKLKEKQASKGKPIDEQDELVRLQTILEKHGVRLEIRQPLADSLVLWKHDEDQK